jgi:uncharacterized membrane protein YtjA (UPF0391 family)
LGRNFGRLSDFANRAVRHLFRCHASRKASLMLCWALLFFIFAFITGVMGFAGVAMVSASVAKMLFFVFLALLALTFAAYLVRE